MLCGTVFATKTVYFQPNSNWLTENARFALYMFDDGTNTNEWTDFTVVDADNNIYKATFDESYPNMILVRMNGSTTENNWNNKWSQTGDLEAPTADNQLYTLADGQWDGATVNNGLTVTENYAEPVADTSYKVDFNTTISTSAHDFAVASNWGHVSGYDSKYDSNMSYSWSGTAGVDKTGALLAYRQYKYDWGQSSSGVDVYDLLITPEVKGTVSLAVKQYSGSNSYIEFYEMTDNGDGTFTRGNIIEYTKDAEAEFSQSAYVTVSITVADFARIGIRASYMYLDDFAADEANIIPEKAITIASADPAATTGTIYWDQQANGKVLVKYTVTVTNTGDVDLTQGTEGYSVSIFNRTTEDVYSTTAVPQDLAVGETSEPFVVQAEVESSVWPNTYTYYSMDLRENLKNSVLQRAQSRYNAYQSKFIFREAESTSTSSISSAEAWGTITESTAKSFEIYNDGLAPLTINSITLPEGFTSADAPVIPAEGLVINGKEKVTFSVTQDATAQGTFAGTLTIAYLSYGSEQATNYTLNFSATVIGANTWAVDFNNTKSGIIYPAGAIVEAGINSDYDYNSGTYNYWLTGRTQSSYASGNNMFITPKLHANADDKLAYDVKGAYGSSYYAKVYVSTDRKNWSQVAYYTQNETEGAEAIGYSNWYTKTITFDAEGDYYVAFSLYGTFKIDNIIGLTKVDVAHDLYIKSVNWPDASVKSGTSLSKPSLEVIPLTEETAEAYTVKYVCGETVLAEGTPVALTASTSSSKTFSFSWTPNVENTTVYENTKVVFDFGGGVTFETEPFNLTVTNEAIFHFVKTMPSSKWNEPSDHTTPIAFGKTNTADAQTFYIYNWGAAPLTVNGISLPEGFTTSVDFPIVVPAFDENNLSAAAQALDITFSATEAGTFGGDMVITHSGNQTFTLAVSGTKLDPAKFYANFDDGSWPAGSVYQSNISSTNGGTYSAPNYYISSSSTTNNIFVTPKLTAAAGDKLLFDAKLYSSYWSEGKVVVYAAATREEVLNAEEGTTRTQLFSVSGQDETNPMTTDYQTFEVPAQAGDYYYGFEISNRPYVDEIYGLTPVAVAHDWTIASSNVPAEAMQNVVSTATVNILNLGLADEVADSYTVTAYVDGKAVATGEAVAIPVNHKLSDAGTQLSVEFRYPETGTFPVYVEVKAGDYSVKTDPVNVTFAEEVFISDAIAVGTRSSSDRDHAIIDFYNLDGGAKTSDIVYTAAQLNAFGIKAGAKITALSFMGTISSAKTISNSLTAWVGMKTGDITWNSPDKTAMTEVAIFDGTMAFVAGNNEIKIDLSENPITYDGDSDLRIYFEGTKGGWVSLSFDYDNNYQNMKWSENSSMKANPLLYVTLAAEPASLAGTVKTSGREAIKGATVTLKADNCVQYSGTTDETGAYNFNVIQAGLDFTATVEAEGYLKKEFAYNLGGESKTLNTTLYKSYGIVGSFPGFDWDHDKVMTQSTEDPNEFTYVIEDVELVAGTEYEFKLRADGIWKADNNDGYQLPNDGNEKYTPAKSGLYTLTFTANVADHSLEMDAQKQLNTYTATFTTNTGWEKVYAYAWTGEGESTVKFLGDWPGTELTAAEGVYTVSIQAEAAPEKIIFNNGTDAQTENLDFVNGKAYEYGAIPAENLYVIGSGTTNEWNGTTEMNFNEETQAFECTVETVEGDAPLYIAFADIEWTASDEGWADFNANHRYAIGEGDQDATFDKAMMVKKFNGSLELAAGKYNISVTKDLQCTVTPVISEDVIFTPFDGDAANVVLERTFSNANWNTFVVPFDIDNATLTEKFGNDVQVAEYSDAGTDANNVTVSFNKMTTPAITANVPVLLKTSATAPITFSGVQVKAAAEAKKAGEYFDFVGSYNAQEYVTTGNYYLYENKIYKSTSDNGTFIKGTRAYLKEAAVGARIVSFAIDDEIITGIKVIDVNNNAKENIYNLNGQKVNNVKKGLYIKNGKKVMMK